MEIIGIDHGYAAVKTRSACFPSGIVAYAHEPYTKTDVLEYGGRFFVVGSGRQPLVKDKTSNNNYYLLTLAAIAKELEQRHSSAGEIVLAAGLPLTGFGRDKTQFIRYLLRDGGSVSFKYEGRPYEVVIKRVFLYPQGYAAALMHLDLIEGEPSVILADIGGWTVDAMRLDNLKPNAATCRSLELGMICCVDEIAEQVRRTLGLSLTAAQIEAILTGAPCSVSPEAGRIVTEQGKAYVDRLLSAIAESGFDVKAIPVVFMGGGAKLVERHLPSDSALCCSIFLDDVRANAIAYEELAKEMLLRDRADE